MRIYRVIATLCVCLALAVTAASCGDNEALVTVVTGESTTITAPTTTAPTTTAPATTESTATTIPSTTTVSSTTTTLGRIAVELVRIIDGDTIEVQMPDGSNERVRYIGVDCPETDDEYGAMATAYNEQLLCLGPLSLELDVDEYDRYGRLLAYVWAGDTCINHRLVLDGYAQIATYPPNVKYVETFQAAQEAARNADAGLWGAATTTTETPTTTTTEAPTTTVSSEKSDGPTVYITNTGAKYHRAGCRHLKKSKIPISLADAKAQGYEPCKVCKPPQ